MKNSHKHYEKLHSISRTSRILAGISNLLDWDQETHMPPAAYNIRSEQMKILAGLIHKSRTSSAFSKALSNLINLKNGRILAKNLNKSQEAALRVWRRDYLKETCLPSKFVEEFAQLTSQAINAWREAKSKNSFSLFAPLLEKIITANRKKADYLRYNKHPYDALIDLYEPEMTLEEISEIFLPLRKSTTALLKRITDSKKIDDRFLFGKFDREKQIRFSHILMAAIGYDTHKGRLDVSAHPFSSSSHPTDSRITTRIHPTSLMSNIFVVMHECGHSLYEMGLPEEHYGSPLGESISLGVHESQSRWWETRIGASKAFWLYFLPILKQIFPKALNEINNEVFYKAINKVEPSLIRVDADEVTYNLHIILRFELEKALIEGSLAVKDIPEAWNAKTKELLGLIPPTDAEGCLQDIHWSMGSFGYFPTYTLGNLYASHLFSAFEKKHPDWEKHIAKGDFAFITDWLYHNVYRFGRQYNSKELLKNATGKEFSAAAYNHYITKKYKDIYSF